MGNTDQGLYSPKSVACTCAAHGNTSVQPAKEGWSAHRHLCDGFYRMRHRGAHKRSFFLQDTESGLCNHHTKPAELQRPCPTHTDALLQNGDPPLPYDIGKRRTRLAHTLRTAASHLPGPSCMQMNGAGAGAASRATVNDRRLSCTCPLYAGGTKQRLYGQQQTADSRLQQCSQSIHFTLSRFSLHPVCDHHLNSREEILRTRCAYHVSPAIVTQSRTTNNRPTGEEVGGSSCCHTRTASMHRQHRPHARLNGRQKPRPLCLSARMRG